MKKGFVCLGVVSVLAIGLVIAFPTSAGRNGRLSAKEMSCIVGTASSEAAGEAQTPQFSLAPLDANLCNSCDPPLDYEYDIYTVDDQGNPVSRIAELYYGGDDCVLGDLPERWTEQLESLVSSAIYFGYGLDAAASG